MSYDFNADLRKGRYAELKFMGYLAKEGFDYTDVGKVRMYQKMDIDIVIHGKDFDIDIEVKSDEGIAKSGNLAIETISSRNIWSDGWIKYTKAKWLIFYVPQEDIFYKFRTKYIKEYIETKTCREVNAGSGRCKLVPIKGLVKFIEDKTEKSLDESNYIIDVSDIKVDKEKLEIVA